MFKVLLDLLIKMIPQIIAFLQSKAAQPAPKAVPATPVPTPTETAVAPALVVDGKVSFTLTRKQFRPDGVFSILSNSKGEIVAHTLEHSYENNLPKVPNGVYKCIRGPHRLHNMVQDFYTFEIMGVVGHDNILFHWGNYEKDSDGCVLVGEIVVESKGIEMVTNSKATFAKWMASLEGIDDFELTVN